MINSYELLSQNPFDLFADVIDPGDRAITFTGDWDSKNLFHQAGTQPS